MRRYRPIFTTGNHPFSKHFCTNCMDVTLHKRFACIHCGDTPEGLWNKPKTPPLAPREKIKLMDSLRLLNRKLFSGR